MSKKKQNRSRTKRSQPAPQQPGMHYLEYQVTSEPLEDSAYQQLPRDVKAEIDNLYHMVHTDPKRAIPEIQRWLEQYPHIATLYNYLSVAYSKLGDLERVNQIVKENYERNPDYLFAKLNYAELCLKNNQLEQIPIIFDNKFDFKFLYPERNQFHVSEFVGFMGIIGLYFHKIGDISTAQRVYDMLKQVDPSHPYTLRLGQSLVLPSILNATKRLFGRR